MVLGVTRLGVTRFEVTRFGSFETSLYLRMPQHRGGELFIEDLGFVDGAVWPVRPASWVERGPGEEVPRGGLSPPPLPPTSLLSPFLNFWVY